MRIILRADSGFAREALMAWCEANGVDCILGLAKNVRLIRAIGAELAAERDDSRTSGQAARQFKDLTWSTRKSWSRELRVIGKVEWTQEEANPRFIVTSLTAEDGVALPRRPAEIATHLRTTDWYAHRDSHTVLCP